MGSGAGPGGMAGAVPPGGIASMMGQMSPGMGGAMPQQGAFTQMGGQPAMGQMPLPAAGMQPTTADMPALAASMGRFGQQGQMPGMRVGQTGVMPPNAQGRAQGLQGLMSQFRQGQSAMPPGGRGPGVFGGGRV